MPVKDISRFLFQPAKRYSGVRMQQGRVILDSDWNESERIDDEELRRTLLDVLCSNGTSNKGFRISAPRPKTVEIPAAVDPAEGMVEVVETYDFRIATGTFYLGGLRFEVPRDRDMGYEPFLGQPDWLQIDAEAANLPSAPSPDDLADDDGNPTERHDLVYLRGWEQPVGAVEDGELRERALGGPDTSVRVRRTRRVEVLPDVAAGCDEAFAELVERLTAPLEGDRSGWSHGFDRASSELVSKARLTLSFTGGEEEDPCKPRVTAGFLGAENQTIRVELTATDRFLWGHDNASPLYRVQVLEKDGEAVKIRFLTRPPDEASRPRAEQAVEILPWGSILPNGEKVAELRGHLATVVTDYDPDDPDGPSITLSRPVPSTWLAWLDAHSEYRSDRDPEERNRYLYLRLWTGGSGDLDAPDHPFTPGEPVPLGTTGLVATFTAHGLPGDHWIVAARPHTPDTVVPWELMDGAPPAGTRTFLAPLAVITWSVAPAENPNREPRVVATVHDCRARFRPLCEIQGCCTVTVGDDRVSHGDFRSLQDAVDALPADGGEICLLPGVHEANVRIVRRRNVRIHGCGRQTLVLPARRTRLAPIVSIQDSHGVTLEGMDMVTLEGTAVVVSDCSSPNLQRPTRIVRGEPASLSLRDAEISDVLRSIARLIDVEIDVPPGLEGRVTLDLKDVTWDQALDAVLRTRNLDYRLEGDLIRVVPISVLGQMAETADVEVADTRIWAFRQAIRVEGGRGIRIHHNRIRMLDREGGGVGILLLAEDAVIERNDLGVVPAGRTPPSDGEPGERPDPSDPCEDPEALYTHRRYLLQLLDFAFSFQTALPPETAFRALGGIQIAAGSERVKVLENRIHGGAGNGITLGGGHEPTPVPDFTIEEHDIRRNLELYGVPDSFIGAVDISEPP